MTGKEYSALRAWFEDYAAGFGENGGLPPMLELKRLHSLRVAENAGLLANGLGRGKAPLVQAAGLLHDVGRFSQFRTYGSFRDADTVDHGAEGRKVLQERASGLFRDPREGECLFAAVEFHNRRTEDIPSLEENSAALLGLLRDADKLDIIEVVLDSVAADGFQDLPAMLPHIGLGRELTPGLLAKAAAGEGLYSSELRTVADMLLLAASWFYDLNSPAAHRLAARRGLLPRLRRELPATEEVNLFFSELERESKSAAGDFASRGDRKSGVRDRSPLRKAIQEWMTGNRAALKKRGAMP